MFVAYQNQIKMWRKEEKQRVGRLALGGTVSLIRMGSYLVKRLYTKQSILRSEQNMRVCI